MPQGRYLRITVGLYAVLILLFLFLLPPYLILNNPDSPYRAELFQIMDGPLGRTPGNGEARGIFTNPAAAGAKEWRVALYDGQKKHRLFFGIGGDTFWRAASSERFTHRINAGSPAEATALLETLRSQKPEGTKITELAVFDHGKSGLPYLGSGVLDETFYREVARLHESPGDLVLGLYGCSVAEGEKGRQFLKETARITAARVAASRRPVTWSLFHLSYLPYTDESDWTTVGPE